MKDPLTRRHPDAFHHKGFRHREVQEPDRRDAPPAQKLPVGDTDVAPGRPSKAQKSPSEQPRIISSGSSASTTSSSSSTRRSVREARPPTKSLDIKSFDVDVRRFMRRPFSDGSPAQRHEGFVPHPAELNATMLPPGRSFPFFYPSKSDHRKGDGKGKDVTLETENPRNGHCVLLGEKRPGWHYALMDEVRRSFVGYLQCPFMPSECAQFFETIKMGTDWTQPMGRVGPMPRKTGWMVLDGCSCKYCYGGVEVAAQTFPPWMKDLMRKVMGHCGLTEVQWPDSCNLNLYEDGNHSVGWHADDEALFQGRYKDIRIISLSLGERRKFEVRANCPTDAERPLMLSLGDGDLCTMEGMMQKHYQHRVPKEMGIRGARINLTWRWIFKHTPRCPALRR